MSLVEVKDLYKIYNPGENEVRALDGINLTVEKGEFLARSEEHTSELQSRI